MGQVPREAGQSLSLGIFKTHLETALSNQIQLGFEQEKGLGDPLRSLPAYISLLFYVIQPPLYFTEER